MRGDDLHHRGTENTEIERSGDVGLRGQETELALGQITEQIIGAAIEVHKVLGPVS
jgi:hypothetical protein